MPSSATKRFRFSFGNSANGPIGGVLVVKAKNKTLAFERARTILANEMVFADHLIADADERNEYFNVYLNGDALQLTDLQDVEDIEDE